MTAVLRPWRPQDACALRFAVASAPDLAAQVGGADLSTDALAATYIEHYLRSDSGLRSWAVVVDDQAVGNVSLSAIERRHGTAWVSYWLAEPARGRGLAARALAAVAPWAFEDGLFRLELGHRTNNPASCAVATRAGFPAEGVERQKLRYDDTRFDVETHARLATDPSPAVEPLPFVIAR
ncbi:GNAT family N-acetyltransferase [Sanguibacter suaedae]|uniref:GNAT family N-acetyltransferase n=1 Tax=Sanguibacter suaedae TaxID=2795737 RepID=A0A934IFA7_9MICO|nr:GNAT family protein [Sanguibacter suaedae]MBI9115899.1 GNAT family N-acetyltransferase [Sanguibacter suaedae]